MRLVLSLALSLAASNLGLAMQENNDQEIEEGLPLAVTKESAYKNLGSYFSESKEEKTKTYDQGINLNKTKKTCRELRELSDQKVDSKDLKETFLVESIFDDLSYSGYCDSIQFKGFEDMTLNIIFTTKISFGIHDFRCKSAPYDVYIAERDLIPISHSTHGSSFLFSEWVIDSKNRLKGKVDLKKAFDFTMVLQPSSETIFSFENVSGHIWVQDPPEDWKKKIFNFKNCKSLIDDPKISNTDECKKIIISVKKEK